MKGNKKILIVAILLLLITVSFTTYAIYKSSDEGDLKYKIDFIESNPKYKLKKNDKYIVDHHVSASELNVENVFFEFRNE